MTPEELRSRRERLGLRQIDLAREMHLPYRTYVMWERGHRWPGWLTQVGMECILDELDDIIQPGRVEDAVAHPPGPPGLDGQRQGRI